MADSNPFFEDEPAPPSTNNKSNPFDSNPFADNPFDADDVFGSANDNKQTNAPVVGTSTAFATTTTTTQAAPALPPKVAVETSQSEEVNFFEAAFNEPQEQPAKEKKKSEKERIAPKQTASMASDDEEEESSSSSSSSDSDSEDGDEENQKKKKKKKKQKKCNWYHVFTPKFYKEYYQVNTMDVLKRIMWSVVPIGDNFITKINPRPDFYGPFWITTTVIFLLALVSNCVEYAKFSSEDAAADFGYDWTKIVVTLCVLYGYLFVLPIIFWGIQKYFGGKLRVIDFISVYGYTFVIYLPIGLLCLISVEWVLWVLIMIACAVSTFNIVIALWPHLTDQISAAVKFTVLGLVIGFHVALALFFKLYLFLPSAIDVPTHDSQKT